MNLEMYWIQSKVFRDFINMNFMNAKIVIPISVIITIIIVVFSLTQIGIIEKETPPQIGKTVGEIDSMLQQIKEDKIKNDNSNNKYYPKDREWITSGPFKIDRSEYLLGEKVFVKIDQLSNNEKGKVVVFRPVNRTHYAVYHTMIFDESSQRNNYYFTPDLSELGGICSVDELIGEWIVVFQGTDYPDLKFKVIAEIIPGYEYRYETIVDSSNC